MNQTPSSNLIDFSEFRERKVSNENFLREIFGDDNWDRAHVCAFTEDPYDLDTLGLRHYWAGGPAWRILKNFTPDQNQYFTISLFNKDPGTGRFRRKKSLHEATYCIVLDDVGDAGGAGTTATVPWKRIKLPPSWVMETSPGNYQVGYVLENPEARSGKVSALLDAMVASGLCSGGKDPGMKGVTRYVRLPEGTNRKAKYGETGFKHRLVVWDTDKGHKTNIWDLADAYGVRQEVDDAPEFLGTGVSVSVSPGEDMVLDVLSRAGLVKQELSAGVWDIECPWIEEHSGRADSGAAYLSPDRFKCHHGHCQDRKSVQFLEKLREDYPTEWAGAKKEELMRDFGALDDPFLGLYPPLSAQVQEKMKELVAGKFGNALWLDQVGDPGFELDLDGNWLVDQLFPAEGVGALYGAPGVGKSFVAMDLALRVSCGMPWNGHDTDRPGRVVYVNSEGGTTSGAMRMRAWLDEFGPEQAANGDLVMWPGSLRLGQEGQEDEKALIEWAREALGGCVLLVIDTLNRNFSGDENSTQDMTAFVQAADRIRRELGCFVLLVHHSGKDASRGMRGNSALLGAVDAEIEIRRDKEAGLGTPGEIVVSKLREAEDGMRYGFKLKYRKLGVDKKLRDRGSLVAVESAPPAKQMRLGEKERDLLDHIIQNPGLTYDGLRKDIPYADNPKLKRNLQNLIEKELVEETPGGGYVAFSPAQDDENDAERNKNDD